MTGCRVNILESVDLADVWKIVRRRGSKARPYTNGRQVFQVGHVFERTRCHPSQDTEVDLAVFHTKLPRRAEKDLPCASRLDVECDRIRIAAVRRLQIPKLDQLMPDKVGIPLGDR